MYKIIELSLPDELITGIEELDSQHTKIIKLAENLINSVGEHLTKDAVRENLDFLGRYIGVHFRFEEEFLLKIEYPQYVQHKEMHDEFLDSFVQLKLDFSIEGNTDAVQRKISESIISWVLEHIQREDLQFAKYFKQLKS